MPKTNLKSNNIGKDNNELNFIDKCYILINLFIKKDVDKNWSPKDFARERCAIKKLLNKFPELDFYYSLVSLHGKFNSLLGLMSKKYHNIDNLYLNYKTSLDKKLGQVYTLNSNDYTVETKSSVKKPKTLSELLDNL